MMRSQLANARPASASSANSPAPTAAAAAQPWAVASRFAASSVAAVERYRSPASLYSDLAGSIERRARLSEDRPTPAEDVARVVVEKVLRRVPPAVIRCGRGATLLPLLGRLPRRLRDRLLRRSFDLDGPAPGRRE